MFWFPTQEWSLCARFKVPAGPCGWVYVPVFGEAGGLPTVLFWHVTPDPDKGQLTTRQWSSICFTRNRGRLAESWKRRAKMFGSVNIDGEKNLHQLGWWNTVIIHTMYMIYGLLWCQLLQEFCSSTVPPRVPQHFDASTVSSSSHFSACWVFVACFFAISSNIIIINVQFAKAFIIRQTMTQFQHLSTCWRSKVWVSHPCQAITLPNLSRPSKIPSVAMI